MIRMKYEYYENIFSAFNDFRNIMDSITKSPSEIPIEDQRYEQLREVGQVIFDLGGEDALLAAATTYDGLPLPNMKAVTFLKDHWRSFGDWSD